MAERTQAEKPNDFKTSALGGQPGPKMAEAPNWDNSNDFNTPRHRRVMPLAAAGAGPQALIRVRSPSRESWTATSPPPQRILAERTQAENTSKFSVPRQRPLLP